MASPGGRPLPLRGVPAASPPRSGVGRSLVSWSLPLPPPPSGFRGLRDRGVGIGNPSPSPRPGAGLGLAPPGLSPAGETFPNRTELRHPPPSPRPRIPLPLHLLQCLPLPPTRISLRVTDGAGSQSKVWVSQSRGSEEGRGRGLRRTSWSGVARGRGSHGDAESYPLSSIPSRRPGELEGSVTRRGCDPGRHAEGLEILDFSGTTRDVVFRHDEALKPLTMWQELRGPFLKWHILS